MNIHPHPRSNPPGQPQWGVGAAGSFRGDCQNHALLFLLLGVGVACSFRGFRKNIILGWLFLGVGVACSFRGFCKKRSSLWSSLCACRCCGLWPWSWLHGRGGIAAAAVACGCGRGCARVCARLALGFCVPPLLWPVAVVVAVSLSLLWLSLLWPVAMAVAFAVAVTVPVRVWVCDAVRLLYGTLPRRPSRNVVCAAMGVGGPPCPHPSKSYLKVHS
jgi:hypothetical protein